MMGCRCVLWVGLLWLMIRIEDNDGGDDEIR